MYGVSVVLCGQGRQGSGAVGVIVCTCAACGVEHGECGGGEVGLLQVVSDDIGLVGWAMEHAREHA